MDVHKLPDAELTVMQALWACGGEGERRDIEERLSRSMAPTTLLTLLGRLGDRGFLKIEKSGRRTRYTALVSRETYLAGQSRRFFETLCGGDLPAFASALCQSGLSREELAELRALLERNEL